MITTNIAIAALLLIGLSACSQTRMGLHATPAKSYAFQAVQPQAALVKGMPQPAPSSITTLSFSSLRDPRQAPVTMHLKQQGLATMAEIPLAQGRDASLNLTAGRRSEDDWLGGLSLNWKF